MLYAFFESNDKYRFEIAYNKLSKTPISNNFITDMFRFRVLKHIGKNEEANILMKEIRKIYTDKSCQDILDICESEDNKDIELKWDWSFR